MVGSSLSLAILTFIASSIGTITGFGTSTIMVPILSLFFPFPMTLLFVGIIHWFGDIWLMLFFKKGLNWKLITLFGLPGILTAFWAARLPLLLPSLILGRLLGFFLILYVFYLFVKPSWKIKSSGPNAIVGGTLSGFFAGIFGVGGAIRSAFLSSFHLQKEVFLFTSGAIGFLIDTSRISQYFLGGILLDEILLKTLALAIPASFLGAWAGKKLVNKIPQKSFRFFVALGLLTVGIFYLFF